MKRQAELMGREEVQLHAGHKFRHASFITALGKMY